MKNCKPRWVKSLIDWVERELTAVIAVAMVLAFIFSQSLASDENTIKSIVSTTTGVATQQIQTSATSLWAMGSTILFGRDLQGPSVDPDPPIKWTGGTVVSSGTFLTAIQSATVALPVNAGTYNLAVTFSSTITINGTKFSSTSLATQTKSINAQSGSLTVTFAAGAKISKIEAKLPTVEEGDFNTDAGTTAPEFVPVTSITIMPNNKTIVLPGTGTQTFSPVVILTNAVGTVSSDVDLNWSSSDTDIATVNSNGVVTAKSDGVVTITASVVGNNTLTASATVKILPATIVPTVDVTPTDTSIDTGSTLLDKLAETLKIDSNVNDDQTATPQTTTNDADNQTALDQLAENQATSVVASPTTGGDEKLDLYQNTLDAYAQTQTKKYEATGTMQLSGAEMRQVVNQTQTTTLGKVTATVKLTLSRIVPDLKTMFVGSTTTLTNGTQVKQLSVFNKIGNWFTKTFITGAGASSTDDDTMGASFGGTDTNE
jgi:hypothetical protein